MDILLLLMIFCFLAGLVQTTSGLGYTIVMMALLPFAYAYKSANLITLISSIPVLVFAIISLWKHINFRLLLVPLSMSLLARLISIQLLALPEAFLLKFSGAFLICIVVYLSFFMDKIHLKPTKLNGGIIGFFAGLFGGLTNISGPILVIYFLPSAEAKEEYSATLQFTFLIGCIFTLLINGAKGKITADLLANGALGGCSAILGGIVGLKLFTRINSKVLKCILCGLIAIMGCLQLF